MLWTDSIEEICRIRKGADTCVHLKYEGTSGISARVWQERFTSLYPAMVTWVDSWEWKHSIPLIPTLSVEFFGVSSDTRALSNNAFAATDLNRSGARQATSIVIVARTLRVPLLNSVLEPREDLEEMTAISCLGCDEVSLSQTVFANMWFRQSPVGMLWDMIDVGIRQWEIDLAFLSFTSDKSHISGSKKDWAISWRRVLFLIY